MAFFGSHDDGVGNYWDKPFDTIDIIEQYGLSIRQIPWKVVRYYDVRHKRQEGEIVIKDGQKRLRITKIPKNAGYWMCQQVNHTDRMVRWTPGECHLAETLEDSVKKFLDKT